MFKYDSTLEEDDEEQENWSESIRNAFSRSIAAGVPKAAKLGLSTALNKQIGQMFPNSMPKDSGKPLYRIDSLDHLLIMLLRKQMVLVKPELWPDPWEDPILKSSKALASGVKEHFACFAQCWSYNSASAALWQDSRGKGRSVQIETTVPRILDGIFCRDLRCFDAREQFFLKKVEYLSDENSKALRSEIEEQWNNENLPPYDFDDCRLASLFLKRHAFEYENEVRLVWRVVNASNSDPLEIDLYDGDRTSPTTTIIAVSIDPKILIKSVQVDPWCKDSEYQIIEEVLNDFGVPCTKSDLSSPMWKQK